MKSSKLKTILISILFIIVATIGYCAKSLDIVYILMLPVLMGVIVKRIRRHRDLAKERKKAAATSYEDSVAGVLADGLITRMVSIGMEEYLLKDYEPSVKIRSFGWTSKRLTSKCEAVFNELLDYLELPHNIRLEVLYSPDSSGSHPGTYHHDGFNKCVRLNIEPRYKPEQITAVLCHECTHYFMDYHHLNSQVESINEQRTDAMAILLGFGRVLENGYLKQTETKLIDSTGITNTYRVTTYKVGYISVADCALVHRLLLDRRKRIISDRQAKARREDLKKELPALTATLERLTEMCSDALKNISPDRADAGQLMYEFEGLDCSGKIAHLKSLSAGSTQGALQSAVNLAKETCEKLSLLIKRAA